jgi:hypothetical protein
MSMRPKPIGPVPEDTARVARAAFPKGNLYMQMRDVLGTIYADEDFSKLFEVRGPGDSTEKEAQTAASSVKQGQRVDLTQVDTLRVARQMPELTPASPGSAQPGRTPAPARDSNGQSLGERFYSADVAWKNDTDARSPCRQDDVERPDFSGVLPHR